MTLFCAYAKIRFSHDVAHVYIERGYITLMNLYWILVMSRERQAYMRTEKAPISIYICSV